MVVTIIVVKSQCYRDSVNECLGSRNGKRGSSFQSICIGCLWCSVEKDSEVSSRVSGREGCDLIAASAVGLGGGVEAQT